MWRIYGSYAYVVYQTVGGKSRGAIWFNVLFAFQRVQAFLQGMWAVWQHCMRQPFLSNLYEFLDLKRQLSTGSCGTVAAAE